MITSNERYQKQLEIRSRIKLRRKFNLYDKHNEWHELKDDDGVVIGRKPACNYYASNARRDMFASAGDVLEQAMNHDDPLIRKRVKKLRKKMARGQHVKMAYAIKAIEDLLKKDT